MEKVLLISENTLKKYTLINDNVDSKYILPAIQITQDCDLDTLIGTVLNNKIQSLVRDNSIAQPENEHYQELLDEYRRKYLPERMGVSTKTISNIIIEINQHTKKIPMNLI